MNTPRFSPQSSRTRPARLEVSWPWMTWNSGNGDTVPGEPHRAIVAAQHGVDVFRGREADDARFDVSAVCRQQVAVILFDPPPRALLEPETVVEEFLRRGIRVRDRLPRRRRAAARRPRGGTSAPRSGTPSPSVAVAGSLEMRHCGRRGSPPDRGFRSQRPVPRDGVSGARGPRREGPWQWAAFRRARV